MSAPTKHPALARIDRAILLAQTMQNDMPDINQAMRDAARYRHLRDHYLRSCAHPLGDAIGMSDVIFGDDTDAAIDADMRRVSDDK